MSDLSDDPSECFLLDTNVISEVRKPRPDKTVMGWLDVWETSQIYISVVSLCEIRKGLHKMPPGKKRDELHHWLERELTETFKGRILEIDRRVADYWGILLAEYNYDALDMLFAATALVHNLTMVTRNVKDFQIRGLRLMNPWLEYGA
mgnify:CR=1 FL=1